MFLSFLVLPAEASIVLKLIAANPSKTQTQKVTIKTYLPKETKPEDILSKADLDVAYDTQQGSYFVYGEYDLKPQEAIEKDVELVDIWNIATNEIESLRLEVNKLQDILKSTEFSDRAGFLKSSIESKLNQIIESQANSPANPERHISNYRENLKILESAKADLVLLRALLSQAKGLPTVMVWRLITVIIIFLALLGLSFYFIWHKQLKTIGDTFPVTKEETATKAEGPKRHEAKEQETKLEADDIEKIIKEDKSKEAE
jgi:hypothetical protein